MGQVDADTPKQLVTLTYTGKVAAQEIERTMPMIKEALVDMLPRFTLMTDMTALESMEGTCAVHIEQVMDWCNDKQIGTVVRAIPDPTKDIGLNIMSRFHSSAEMELRIYENLADAVKSLE